MVKIKRSKFTEEDHGSFDLLIGDDSMDLLEEIFKKLDPKSLGRASCVSKRWREAGASEHVWEVTFHRHWESSRFPVDRLRSMILALGGFRLMYKSCLHPLRRKTSSWRASSVEDEITLSLSLFSVHYLKSLKNSSSDILSVSSQL
ncbi:hypothetical protein AMTRI_Chr10g4460 [Amborella trichopoda]|uniref:F-box domain-containing protein n=1 Tax=Amborella trichopoda TaxID=13333 RepID=W1NVE9_AMBTC|nr:F-box protein GID2 [Amborella trichopoda]ERN01617.1 hypothetical protein AMTR_s00090p00061470 [Amborella trichopoda]|eukprot:XP_006839048.1 F-box protein GID2 [Amborella trichopoda]